MKKKSHLGKSWDRERQWILNTQKYWMNFISQSWNVNVWRAQTDLKDVTSVLEMRVFVFINFQPVFLSLHTTACVVAAWERACVCCVRVCAMHKGVRSHFARPPSSKTKPSFPRLSRQDVSELSQFRILVQRWTEARVAVENLRCQMQCRHQHSSSNKIFWKTN